MQQAAADHEEVMALSLEERVAQRVQDVKSMTKRPYAPAADLRPPPSSENRFAAPSGGFALGAGPAPPRRRKPRARATNDLADVWASLDKLNEADDLDALDGITLDEDLCAAFDAAARIDDDVEDTPLPASFAQVPCGPTSFAELAIEKLEFGVSLLPEELVADTKYREQKPLLESSDDESDDDKCPVIHEVLNEAKAEAEAFRNRRMGEEATPPTSTTGGKLKKKASPTCVADFADLESGETLEFAKLDDYDREIVYPRNPDRMDDAEATKRGQALAQRFRDKLARKEARDARRHTKAMRKRVLGEEDEDDASEASERDEERGPIPPGAFAHGGAAPAEHTAPWRKTFPAWDESKPVAENLDACLARLRVAAPLADADLPGTAGAAAAAEFPEPGEADEEGAFDPSMLSLVDDGGEFSE